MDNDLSMISKIANPIIIVNDAGLLIEINDKAQYLLKIMNINVNLTISDIDPTFNPEDIETIGHVHKQINFPLIQEVDIFKLMYENKPCYLYLFEENIYLDEAFINVIDSIDDGIIIVNSKGQLESFNAAALRNLTMNEKNTEAKAKEYEQGKSGIGRNLHELLKDNHWHYDPMTPEIVRRKKPLSRNIKYDNGEAVSILTLTGIPMMGKDAEVKRVVHTQRDISRLVELEVKLDEMEKFKQDYYDQCEELAYYRNLNRIVYSSKKMGNILKLAYKVAKTDSSVFITGETGVGKEEVSKYIHANSKRKDKPFIAINCASIPSELMESELFGYEAGAFTGARNSGKKGLFEEACGGTVFLDEIGELPPQMQSKLLRVIQEGSFLRVGSNSRIELDVRYICATNLTNEELTNNNKFRQDLYHRLNVIPIHIPPLRERKDDIMPLIFHFLKFYNDKYDRKVRILKDEIKALVEYNWAGNIRQLKNFIERLVILTENEIVTREEIEANMALNIDSHDPNELQFNEIMPLKDVFHNVEQILIKKAIDELGSITAAAKALEIDPSTIHRKIKRGEIEK